MAIFSVVLSVSVVESESVVVCGEGEAVVEMLEQSSEGKFQQQ